MRAEFVIHDPAIQMIVWPLMAVPIIYFAGRLAGHIHFPAVRNAARWLGFVALLVTWVPLVQTTRLVLTDGAYAWTVGAIALRVDGISLLLAAVALALGTLAMLYTVPYLAHDAGTEKHHALIVAMTGMIIGLGCAYDLFNLWVWFEGMALASYLLVTYYRDQPRSLEAGVKYLIQSATGSVFVLTGIALIFAQIRRTYA